LNFRMALPGFGLKHNIGDFRKPRGDYRFNLVIKEERRDVSRLYSKRNALDGHFLILCKAGRLLYNIPYHRSYF
jgi:hypothetical protein